MAEAGGGGGGGIGGGVGVRVGVGSVGVVVVVGGGGFDEVSDIGASDGGGGAGGGDGMVVVMVLVSGQSGSRGVEIVRFPSMTSLSFARGSFYLPFFQQSVELLTRTKCKENVFRSDGSWTSGGYSLDEVVMFDKATNTRAAYGLSLRTLRRLELLGRLYGQTSTIETVVKRIPCP